MYGLFGINIAIYYYIQFQTPTLQAEIIFKHFCLQHNSEVDIEICSNILCQWAIKSTLLICENHIPESIMQYIMRYIVFLFSVADWSFNLLRL
jgi:hypothetical protein